MIRLRSCLVLSALLAFAGGAHAQQSAPPPAATLDIHAPPRRELGHEQLLAVARDIRALEANPLASDAEGARRDLAAWVMDSPDVTVTVCERVVGPLMHSRSRYHDLLAMQFMLSSAAYAVEHPDQASDLARMTAGGLEGILATYAALKAQQGDQAADPVMEQFAALAASGGLEARAAELAAQCR